MSQKYRSETKKVIYRIVFLVSILILGYALAATGPKKPVSDIPEKQISEPAGKTSKGTADPPGFIPSEKVSADKSVSFPTDI